MTWRALGRPELAVADRTGGVVDGGKELTGRGFIEGRNQHANPLQLQLRLLSSGIVC